MPRGLGGLAYRDLVNEVRSGPLTVAEVAEIVGVNERQVHNWSNGTNRPKGQSRERLLELNYIVKQLQDVYAPEGIEIWLHGRHRSLDGRRPVDLLRQQDFRTVLDAVERLQSGAM